MTCALVPLNPNELMAARRTWLSRFQSLDSVTISAGKFNSICGFNVLKCKGITPELFIDKNAPITTPYDIYHNQQSDDYKINGTCGRGVGSTFQREEDFYSLVAGDLLYKSVLKEKLDGIRHYYHSKGDMSPHFDFDRFYEACESVVSLFNIVDERPRGFDEYIFESSQGLMLDQNFGFFPYVTRSSVGTKNILEMGFQPELHLMTRAYQTRHGNGPMTNCNRPHTFDNKFESNDMNKYQGEFKTSLLDLDLLKYAISRDEYIRNGFRKEHTRKLVITCMDVVEGNWKYTMNDKLYTYSRASDFVEAIGRELDIRVETTSYPWLQ